jgi:hypothetical protein
MTHASRWFGCVGRVLLAAVPLSLVACGSDGRAPEGTAVSAQSLSISGVHFQTVQGGQYLGAQNNGGGAVNATAVLAQGWETFTLIDSNGGALTSGDPVFIQAGNGQFFQAVNGGGSTLNAGSNNQLGWETFKIVKQSGGGVITSAMAGPSATISRFKTTSSAARATTPLPSTPWTTTISGLHASSTRRWRE